MKQHSRTLPPEPSPKRERIFSMRLTDAEREAIKALAKRLHLPASRLARHFVLEAVAFHNRQTSPEGELDTCGMCQGLRDNFVLKFKQDSPSAWAD